MIDVNMITTLSEAEIENPNLFPFPLSMHIVFAVIGLLFFIYRFMTDKKPFQLIFAFAIPFSLTIWLFESRTWFYILGATEAVLIICAFVTTFFFKDKPAEEKSVEPENSESPAAEQTSELPEAEAADEQSEEVPAETPAEEQTVSEADDSEAQED